MKPAYIVGIIGAAGIGLAFYRKRQQAAVGAIYKTIPDSFYTCKDGTYSDHNNKRACAWHGGVKDEAPVTAKCKEPASQLLQVRDVRVHSIQLYLKAFQNRETEYSAESVKRIKDAVNSGTFRIEEFDPVLLWKKPGDGNYYMLSGHSRLQAFRELCSEGKKNFCSIPSKIITVPQAEAEEIALRSNTLSTKETDTERAMYYRKQIMLGKPYGAILDVARKSEGNNAIRILSYAYLNPDGKTFTALKALEGGEPGSQMIIKSIAQWIGEARMKFPMLTNQHENEVYDWLINGAYGKQFKKKQDFLAKLATVINNRTTFGNFDAANPLNLINAASKSFAEKQLDEMLLEKKMQIQALQKSINTKIADYRGRGATQQQILSLMANDNALLNRYQLEYIELDKKRTQAVEDGAKQFSIFGYRNSQRNTFANHPTNYYLL